MDSTLQTTTSSSISEQKYINLRKRLDQLGYRQTLGIESLPLIEKLFNDLVHTTDSLKKAKLEICKNTDQANSSLKHSISSTSSDLIPPSIQAYKSDNAKLIKENNELHLELIKIKDDFEAQIKDLKSKLNKVEHENSDLRFLNTQYLHKLRAIEKESKDKSKKILELQEKNFQAVIQIPGSASKQAISFRRQRLDIDCMLPPPSPTPSSQHSSNDPYIIDMIKLADERLSQLQADLDNFKQSNEILENKVCNFKNQVENREREIERLNRLLDGGRSYDVVSLEANLRNNEKLIAHQNIQIEFLQEKNHELENRLQTRRGNDIVDKLQDDKSKLTKKITKLLENERDLVHELDSLKERRSKSPSKRTGCSVCSPSLQSQTEDTKQLRRERDELQSLLDKFERHMAEIQSNVKVLTNERDNYQKMYEEAKNSKGNSLAAQTIIKRVEAERDSVLFDLRNTVNERDSLKERLKLTSESVVKEAANLEHQVDRCRKLEIEKIELCKQIDLLQNQLEQLENKIHSQTYHLVQTEQDLTDQKSASTQIRFLAEESERALDEQRRQLAFKSDEVHQIEQVKFRIEQKVLDLQDLNRALKDEISGLRMTVTCLDKDKDKLLMSVDEKTVENVTLKQELATKHRRIDELNSQLSQLDAALDRSNDELKNKMKEITALRMQVDRTNEENSDFCRRFEAACRENKRMQDDLITVTRENQVLHCELEKSNGDRDHLKEQLQDYINEVSKFEEMLKQKELDRSNLLEQYRDISNEMSSLKMALNSYENDSSNLKIEIQMKHADNKRLRERLDVIERDFQQQMAACQEYDVKLSSANRNLQRFEEQLKKCQSENKDILQDLMHSRELNVHLEQSKEDLTRQLTSRELDFEQLQNQLGDKRAENDLLKSQVNSERAMVKNLEELIGNNREKDFHMQLSTQERDSEIKLLKDRVVLSEQKIQTQNKEINALRGKIVEYETDNERLKRQLTNERFERERAAQELRKMSENSDLASSSCRFTRSISPIRIPIPIGIQGPPPCMSSIHSIHSHSGSATATAAAVAAAAAAVAASNVAAAASGYRSLSPVRSRSPSKEHHLTTSSLRYSCEKRNLSPSKDRLN